MRFRSLYRTLSTQHRRKSQGSWRWAKKVWFSKTEPGGGGEAGSLNPRIATRTRFDGEETKVSPVRQDHQERARAHTDAARGHRAKTCVISS